MWSAVRGASIALLLFGATSSSHADPGSTHVLRYRVTHSRYGEIGTYTNNIVSTGATTIVETQIHLAVRLLGIVVHREDAERAEVWNGNRLAVFHGATIVNGQTTKISGKAGADGFTVTTPQGVVVAPADIRPSNPWSAGFLTSNTMLRSDTGLVEQVAITGPKIGRVKVGAASVEAREYDIAATPSYRIWLDSDDVPVMFNVSDESGQVTFTLTDRS